MRSRRSTAHRLLVVSAALGVVVWLLLMSCKEGQPPYQVISENGTPKDFLPPDGVVPGTTHEQGLLYRFDRVRYRLFPPISGTDPHFIKRDSVLALASAGTPGSPTSLLTRPDLSDPTLGRVYADPRLFGFVASDAAQADQFVEGRTVSNVGEFIPLQVGNWWEEIHNQREWVVIDSVVATAAPSAEGMPVFQMRSTATARGDLGFVQYKPAQYSWDRDLTSASGTGIFFHAWTIISEREIQLAARPDRQTDRQRNPRWLWLSIQSIPNFSGDPAASPPQTIDQCLDALPSHLDPYPVKFCGPDVQEGETYSTWTYLDIADADLHQRLNSESELPRGGRCGISIVVGADTLQMFPTRSFRLLAEYVVTVERIVDQVEIKIGTQTVGRYPNQPEPGSVVKFVVRMFLNQEGSQTTAQFMELYYLRGIGEVIRTTGVEPTRRSNARLRSCVVNGVTYPPNNSRFFYSD